MKVQLNPTSERPARYQQHQYRPTDTTRTQLTPPPEATTCELASRDYDRRIKNESALSEHAFRRLPRYSLQSCRTLEEQSDTRRKSSFTIHTSRHRHLPRLRDYCGANDARRRARANVLCVRLAYHLTSPTGESERASLPVQKRKKGAY